MVRVTWFCYTAQVSISIIKQSVISLVLISSVGAAVPNAPDPEHDPKKVIDLQPVVVTSQREQVPLRLEFDASAAIQPIPAQDGADFLKHIPGFSIIRKGGIDGDPVLRGVGGSRISISVDGETILGGCGQRMDPPTAYVFPTSFDRVVITKGPQTVLYGPGNSAGVVRFERDIPHIGEASGATGNAYTNVASFGRFDLGGEYNWMGDQFYARLNSTRSSADRYETGAGEEVHADYERWSFGSNLGWMFDEKSNLELSFNTSDGEASYADRAMDGIKFARDNVALRFRRDIAGGLVQSLEAQVYYNYVDHVMDNFSLRDFTTTAMMPNPAVSNPDRLTYGGKLSLNLSPNEKTDLSVGAEYQVNDHSIRKTMNENMMPYEVMARTDDASFDQIGLFAESEIELEDAWTLVFGGRLDLWSVEDLRQKIAVMMMGTFDNPTAGADRSETLPSGFARIERQLQEGWGQWYVGIGYVSRFPDYWELFSKESSTTLSAFDTDPESTLQLDVGWIVEHEHVGFSASAFMAQHNDFILIESGFQKAGMMGNTRSALIARNVDASTMGLEVSVLGKMENGVYSSASLAYVRGENDTDDLPLAQIPPLEGRIELGYRREEFSAGALLRIVSDQDRVAPKQGNIVGQDIGPSDGFAVVSLHGSYRLSQNLSLAAGVDNLFDELYAEHLSRAGGAVAGFTQTVRVNEPGRVFWMRADLRF